MHTETETHSVCERCYSFASNLVDLNSNTTGYDMFITYIFLNLFYWEEDDYYFNYGGTNSIVGLLVS